MSSSFPSLKPRACEFCGSTASLLRCAGCKAIYYCGLAHQKAHRPVHKTSCDVVKSSLIVVMREEIVFRATQFGGASIDTAPTDGAGLFGQFLEAQKYVKARANWIETLLREFGHAGGRRHIVETALEHSMTLMRDTQEDSAEVRRFVPSLLLRLGRDQEAYDFIKWHAILGPDGDWEDAGGGFLSLHGADVLEYPEFEMANQAGTWPGEPVSENLGMLSAMALIKVRILIDLRNIQNAFRALDGFVLPEILDLIRGQLLSSALKSRPDILRHSKEDLSSFILNTQLHILALHDFANESNDEFWPLLINGERDLQERPTFDDNYEIAWDYVTCTQPSWEETPGALESIQYAAYELPQKQGSFSYEYVVENSRTRLVAKDVSVAAPGL